jgi:hypothetical protein
MKNHLVPHRLDLFFLMLHASCVELCVRTVARLLNSLHYRAHHIDVFICYIPAVRLVVFADDKSANVVFL